MARKIGVLTDEMVSCRSIGHNWDDNINPNHFPTSGYPLYLRCVRCTTQKYIVFDSRGNREGSTRYIYPEGYRQGSGVTRAQMYVELFRRKRAAGIVTKHVLKGKIHGLPTNVVPMKRKVNA